LPIRDKDFLIGNRWLVMGAEPNSAPHLSIQPQATRERRNSILQLTKSHYKRNSAHVRRLLPPDMTDWLNSRR
jgi:hypothetical protein